MRPIEQALEYLPFIHAIPHWPSHPRGERAEASDDRHHVLTLCAYFYWVSAEGEDPEVAILSPAPVLPLCLPSEYLNTHHSFPVPSVHIHSGLRVNKSPQVGYKLMFCG